MNPSVRLCYVMNKFVTTISGGVRCPEAVSKVGNEGAKDAGISWDSAWSKGCHSCESRNPEVVIQSVQRGFSGRLGVVRTLDSRFHGNDMNTDFSLFKTYGTASPHLPQRGGQYILVSSGLRT